MIEREAVAQRALVVHPVINTPKENIGCELEEAVGLATALDVCVFDQFWVPIRSIKVGNYFGQGKIDEIAEKLERENGNLVIVNTALSPIQQRNLERKWNVKVLDRTGLILEIFARRAATKEGRLQVELARLAYERSRLVRTWTHLERQRGGQGFLAGPGETQIESDRRILAQKIAKLRKDLDQVRRTRALQRHKRKRAPERIVALIGYTNAGKSTLFNLVTEGNVLAKDMLFATLDTTHRVLNLPRGQKCVLSDTVGFISDLPTELIDAFRATLEEVKEADLLIHVRDMSDKLRDARKNNVMAVLASLKAGPKFGQDMIEVWNKTDLLSEREGEHVSQSAKEVAEQSGLLGAYPLSCITGNGLDRLMNGIEFQLARHDQMFKANLQPKDAKIRSWLHRHGQILAESIQPDGSFVVSVRLPQANAGMFFSRYPEIAQKIDYL